jgi:hypothetical protein
LFDCVSSGHPARESPPGGRHHWGGRDGGADWGRQSCQEQSREEREMVAVERIKDDRWDLHVWWKNFS